ncbi:MAG: hypothetical protein IPM24_27085 [Bryobacterales bacterium]|jgi:uncharacterized protein (TIGR03437 family)|nr:hypothetical protein [Bryobacterales bacterium]
MKTSLKTALLVCAAAATLSAQGPLAVINGARFEVRYPVAPGAYAQAYGSYAGVTAQSAPSVPLPTELGGVRVLVGQTAAPLYAVGPDVVSFVVPQNALPAGESQARVNVRVVRGETTLAQGPMDVVSVSPGIFFALGDELAQGGILNQDSQYAVQGAPARRGGVIQIFATGQGALDGTVADGAVPAAGTLVNARGVTKVYVSVDEAQVLFSGLSPQFPGLWQINAIVPDKSYISGQVPVVVTIDGVPSNQVSFWVTQ